MTAQIKEFIEQEFYYFHQHPELSYQEFGTTERLKGDLEKAGIKIIPSALKTGLIAQIGHGKRVVALRADIDALKIKENTDLPYKSVNEGIMHACGHDSHAAAVLGAALLLKEKEESLNGTVRIIFQPAEEAPGGAQQVIDAGGLDNVEAIFGIHSAPIFEVGSLGIAAGPTCAAVEKFKIVIEGRGTHAAHPELGNDPLLAASQFVGAVQSIVSRNILPGDPAVISVTRLDAGTSWNIIPNSVELEGTIRTYSRQARAIAKKNFERVLNGTASAFGVKATLSWIVEVAATNNDETLSEFAKAVAKEQNLTVHRSPQSMGGEDFSLYQERVKGLFIQFGTGLGAPNHNPSFKVDPASIYPTSLYLEKLIERYLEQ
ncbi:MAG: amidohydrolase [Succinivibrio sp.]